MVVYGNPEVKDQVWLLNLRYLRLFCETIFSSNCFTFIADLELPINCRARSWAFIRGKHHDDSYCEARHHTQQGSALKNLDQKKYWNQIQGKFCKWGQIIQTCYDCTIDLQEMPWTLLMLFSFAAETSAWTCKDQCSTGSNHWVCFESQALMFMHVRPDHTLTLESAWKYAPGWHFAEKESMLPDLFASRRHPGHRGKCQLCVVAKFWPQKCNLDAYRPS